MIVRVDLLALRRGLNKVYDPEYANLVLFYIPKIGNLGPAI